MAIKTYFINSANATYNDNEFAWFQSLMLTEGVIGDPTTGVMGLEVTENDVPDMSVLVSVGKALVELTKSGRTFKVVIENDAEVQVVVPANSSGLNRVDAIIVRVDKDVEPNSLKTNVTSIALVQGSGATALTDGAIDTAVGSDGWYRLADVTVPDSDTAVTNSQIADTRAKVAFTDGMAFDAEFIDESAGAADAGKVPTLNANGQMDGSFFKQPVVKTFTLTNTFGDSTTQFDITNPSGTTFRYTWDSTGTNPNISAGTVPVGTELYLNGQNFHVNNKGAFVVTASGANYFEITNAAGVVESNKTLGTGAINYCYIPPDDLLYAVVESQGAGAGGASGRADGGGGAGGYSKKVIAKTAMGSYEIIIIGVGGAANTNGGNTSFGSILTTNGGVTSSTAFPGGGNGGTATGGDLNVNGQSGNPAAMQNDDSANDSGIGGQGGDSMLGRGGKGGYVSAGGAASGYGAGGGGAGNYDSDQTGGVGTQGVIIITEHFN